MIEIRSILDVEYCLNGIETVIFDLDDTLYSEKDYVRSGFRRISECLGNVSLENELWAVFERGGKPIDEVLKARGLLEKKELALHAYRFQTPDISLYPGVQDMLARLRVTKKVGIITDGRPEGQRAKIKALGLSVDKLIITDEMGGIEYRKPNPAAYEKMQTVFHTEYHEMAYIGDNIAKDFVAPQRLGMRCIHFINPDGLYH